MERILAMSFKDEAGKKYNISIRDIKEDILESEILAIMDNIIDNKVIETAYGDLVEKATAEIVTKTVDKFLI